MDYRQIDHMIGKWRERMTPQDEAMRRAQDKDPLHHTMLEMMRRFAHIYDEAMRLEDIPDRSRERVLSTVLLGSPDGLESLALAQVKKLYEDEILNAPLRPIPYSIQFQSDEPFKMGDTSA